MKTLDKTTRNYLVIIGVIMLVFLVDWASSLNPTVWEINQQLEDDPQLNTYPYTFRVLSLDNGIATISSPRSASISAARFLGIIYPGLANKSPEDPALMKAQHDLALKQGRAKKLVLAHSDVEQVRWGIDSEWYAAHGITTR